jgi:hypothetical protein
MQVGDGDELLARAVLARRPCPSGANRPRLPHSIANDRFSALNPAAAQSQTLAGAIDWTIANPTGC